MNILTVDNITNKSIMESIFGEGTCYVLYIRPVGGTEI